jgi:hypothetical protein
MISNLITDHDNVIMLSRCHKNLIGLLLNNNIAKITSPVSCGSRVDPTALASTLKLLKNENSVLQKLS